MRFPVNHALPIAALILIGTTDSAMARAPLAPAVPANGPAADYPVVIGQPYTVDGTVWTPSDQLNYDAVGHAAVGIGEGITAAHKTLPLPAYVEVTALDSGRTILVRLERRGPQVNDVLIDLSPAAAAQLGMAAASKGAVRVRRVNPPEQERALLRAGGRAPERMETPEGLLKVLRRKLADQSPVLAPPSTLSVTPGGAPSAVPGVPTTASAPSAPPAPAQPAAEPPRAPAVGQHAATAKPAAPDRSAPPVRQTGTARGSQIVQVATFSSEAAARKVAAQLDGSVSASGRFWRVRLGPYVNRAKAGPALEKAKKAGYSDARILSLD